MSDKLTVGVEEEFQLVDANTMELAHGFDAMMRYASENARQYMKPEFLQCVVECITEPCETIAAVARSMAIRRASAVRLAQRSGMEIVSAGTHPNGRWYQQRRTIDTEREDRYEQLEVMLQDVARSILIYGLHVHVNVEDPDRRMQVFNQARTFLPYILALSANSPFWMGRLTGYQSYRTIVWTPFPMSGVPDPFLSFQAYEDYLAFLRATGALAPPRRIWWDIRPHFKYPTVEFRVADMPLNYQDALGITAFCQALVQTIVTRIDAGQPLPILPSPYINENRWRAARFGLRGQLIDFLDGVVEAREAPATEVIRRALDLVSPAAAQLGSSAYIEHLRQLLRPGMLGGAERQIVAYRKRNHIHDVTQMLVAETLRDIPLDLAWPMSEMVEMPAKRRKAS